MDFQGSLGPKLAGFYKYPYKLGTEKHYLQHKNQYFDIFYNIYLIIHLSSMMRIGMAS